MTMTNDEFFALAERSVWRLETLPQYNPHTDQALAAWQRTGKLLPLSQRPGKQAWMAAVRQAVAAGKQVGRVRIRRQGGDGGPWSYAAYELACYPENAAAGEEIRVAELGAHPELAELDRDFWLMDEGLALVMDYDHDGQFQAMTPTRDPAILARCLAQRDLAVAWSVPLVEYLAAAADASTGGRRPG
jgi:hypothetical protein